MAIVSVAKSAQPDVSPDEVLAMFCYYFPAYTYKQARQMPERRVTLMLKTALREKARHYLELTKIMAAPHTEKGRGVKQLVEHYRRQAER